MSQLEITDDKQIVKFDGYLLHSRRNPQKEAERFFLKNYKKNHLHIVFGAGLGFSLEAFNKGMTDKDHLLLIEPKKEIFKEFKKRIDVDNLGSAKNITVLSGYDDFMYTKILNELLSKYINRFLVVCSANYDKFASHEYGQFLRKLKEQIYIVKVSMNTNNKFSQRWQENFIKNIPSFTKAKPINALNRSIEIPIVVASGGPSLKKQLSLLKKYQDSVFLICAGSTINSLLVNDIRPDLVVTIDGGDANYHHFKSLKIDDIPIVYNPIVHYKIPKEHSGDQFIFNLEYNKESSTWLNNLMGEDIISLIGGGSVANFALEIACLMTDHPIALIGQDLAYTDNLTHADGNKGKREFDDQFRKQRETFYAEGYDGKPVLTDAPFLSMKKSFEAYAKIITEQKRNSIFNCTEGGIAIEELKQIEFQQFLKNHCIKSDKEKLDTSNKTPSEVSKKNLLTSVEFYIQSNKKIQSVSDKLKMLYRERKIFNDKKISKLENDLNNLISKDMLSFIYQPILYKMEQLNIEPDFETENDKISRICNHGYILYNDINITATKNIEWFLDVRNNLEG